MKKLKNKKLIIIIASVLIIGIIIALLYICSSKRVYESLDNMISYDSYSLKIYFHNRIDNTKVTDLEVKIDNDVEYVKTDIQTYYNYEKKLILPFYKEEGTIWYYSENTKDDFYIENYYNFYKDLFNELKKYDYKKTLKGYSIKEDANNFESLKEYMKEIYLRNDESVGISDKYGQYKVKDEIENIELILKNKRVNKLIITYVSKCYSEAGNSFVCDELNTELPRNEVIITFDNYNNIKIKIPSDIKSSIDEVKTA